jgi:uncharacterized membrane protein YedE/YeeE
MRVFAPLVALALLAALLLSGAALATQPQATTLVFALWLGTALGFVFQRSRFCFYCHARDWFEQRDPRGMLALICALAIGLLGYTVVLGSWLPLPHAGRLPPDIHVGPVSWVLVAAGLSFGLGMVISGSCISAHWYRLAEGSKAAPFALLGTALGFVLGFRSWNSLYSLAVADAPVLWLPGHLGYGGALLLQLAVLGALALWLWRRAASPTSKPAAQPHTQPLASPMAAAPASWRALWQPLFEGRWPYWTGGVAVGVISFLAIIRMRPLGVTSTLGSATRELASSQGWIPLRLHGLDGFAGCATAPGTQGLTPHALLLAGLLAGSAIAALLARQFRPSWPSWRDVMRGLLGGVLLGWGAMTGLGCSIGTLLSGSMAGALSGWVFGAAMFSAIAAGLALQRRLHASA